MSHPDEGMIHAWLDGELDAAEAARVEALVKDDKEWAAAAAEARGLVAASSRIIGALDAVPAGVVPKTQVPSAETPVTAGRRGAWWMMRAAAVLVVVAGTTVVMLNRSEEGDSFADAFSQVKDGPRAAATPSAVAEVPSKPAAERSAAADRAAGRKSDPVGGEAKLQNQQQQAPLQQAPQFRQQQAGAGAGLGAVGAQTAQAAPPGAAPGPTLARADVDEKQKLSADSLSARRLDSLSKEMAKSSLGVSAAATGVAEPRRALDATVGTRVSPEMRALTMVPAAPQAVSATASREECYRERVAATGADVVHRVNRSSDTTAVAATPAIAAAASARNEGVTARARAAPMVLRVNGDTLLIHGTGGAVRIAIRVTCPAR